MTLYTLNLNPKSQSPAPVLPWAGLSGWGGLQAVWVAFQPSPAAADPGSWLMHKLGQPVSPLDVVLNGSQAMHAVGDDGVAVTGAGPHAWEQLQIR